VAGSQGGVREIMIDNEEDNECNSEKTNKKNRFEEFQVLHRIRPEKGHLAPRLK
jgi:hypothetical protein